MKRNKPFQVILIAGKKQSGKSTIAKRLSASEHNYYEIGFSYYLKRLCIDLLLNMRCVATADHFELDELKESLIKDEDGEDFQFIQKINGKLTVSRMTYRQFIQIVGTEMFRDTIHQDIWTYPVQKKISEALNSISVYYPGVVIPDFRFVNEYESIENYCRRFGDMVEILTVAIDRPNNNRVDNHPSENSLNDFVFDIVVKNDGTLSELIQKADKIATGSWRLEKRENDIKARNDNNFLNKYNRE